MKSDYFFTVASGGLVLSMQFFAPDDERVSLNIKLDFASVNQSVECETLGLWLTFYEIEKFRFALENECLEVSLSDVNGSSVLSFEKDADQIVLTHDHLKYPDISNTTLFSVRFIVDASFLAGLVRGLSEGVFE